MFRWFGDRRCWLLGVLLAFPMGCAALPTKREISQAKSLYKLGVQQSNRGAFREALALLKRARKKNPYDYWIEEAIGGTLLRMRRPDIAVKHFKRGLELRKDWPRGWNNLGTAYSAMKKWKPAIEAYHKALSFILYQTPCTAEMNLGWAYQMNGQPRKAIQYLVQATSRCPRFCQGHRLLGQVYLMQKKASKAEVSFREVVRRCHKFPPAYYHLGRVLVVRKKYEEALGVLKKCQEKAGDDQPAVYRACRVLWKKISRTQVAKSSSSISITRHPK